MGVYMELNEAKKVLKENGYLMESVKIENIEKFDRDIEFHTERIKKIRQDFIKIRTNGNIKPTISI
jgi:fibrillarin-like rRNA methylase